MSNLKRVLLEMLERWRSFGIAGLASVIGSNWIMVYINAAGFPRWLNSVAVLVIFGIAWVGAELIDLDRTDPVSRLFRRIAPELEEQAIKARDAGLWKKLGELLEEGARGIVRRSAGLAVLLAAALSLSACGAAQAPHDRCVVSAHRTGQLVGVASVLCSVMDIPPDKCARAQQAAEFATDTWAGVCELIPKEDA